MKNWLWWLWWIWTYDNTDFVWRLMYGLNINAFWTQNRWWNTWHRCLCTLPTLIHSHNSMSCFETYSADKCQNDWWYSLASERNSQIHNAVPYLILFIHIARHLRGPTLRQGLFLFSFQKEIADVVTYYSHGKWPSLAEVSLALPRRGGQVSKQMFTVFLRMICSLLHIDPHPTITALL